MSAMGQKTTSAYQAMSASSQRAEITRPCIRRPKWQNAIVVVHNKQAAHAPANEGDAVSRPRIWDSYVAEIGVAHRAVPLNTVSCASTRHPSSVCGRAGYHVGARTAPGAAR